MSKYDDVIEKAPVKEKIDTGSSNVFGSIKRGSIVHTALRMGIFLMVLNIATHGYLYGNLYYSKDSLSTMVPGLPAGYSLDQTMNKLTSALRR